MQPPPFFNVSALLLDFSQHHSIKHPSAEPLVRPPAMITIQCIFASPYV